MCDNNMIYDGYYQGIPSNMMQYNYGYQGIPNNLIGNNPMANMMNNFQNPNIIDLNSKVNTNSQLMDLINRISNLENRVKILEQKTGNYNSYQEDNNSMYMI